MTSAAWYERSQGRALRWMLGGLVSLALVLRLLFGVLWAKPVSYLLHGDAVTYQNMAVNLCLGRGISDTPPNVSPAVPTSQRVPFFPLFLASIYCVFGVNHVPLRIAQALLGTVACLLIYRLGALAWNRKTGVAAASFAAIYQPFIQYYYYGGPGTLFPASFFSFLLVCLACALLAAMRTGRAALWLASGVLLGLSSLTRPEIAPFLVLVGVLAVWHEAPAWRRGFAHAGLVAVAMALVLLPWVVRNYAIHGRFVALSTMGGMNFYLGNNERARGHIGEDIPEAEQKMLADLTEAQRDRVYYRMGLEFWRRHPERLGKLFAKKGLTFLSFYNEDRQVYFNAFYSFMLPFAVLGVLLVVRQSSRNILPLVFVAFLVHYLLISMLFFGEPRYRYAIESFLILLAAYAGWFLGEKVPKGVLVPTVGIWTVLNLLGYFYWEELFPKLRDVGRLIGGA